MILKLLTAAALAAMATTAQAAPWTREVLELADGAILDSAYQWVEGEGDVLIGYECDPVLGFEALYIQTDDRFDPEAGYAPDVPTTFTIDGAAVQISGIFQERDGYVFTYYAAEMVEGFAEVFDRLVVAKQDIDVAFYDKRFRFSAEGVGDALGTAAGSCW